MINWSRSYSKQNTRLLRKLIASGRIRVDAENGRVYHSKVECPQIENHCGYMRFRVKVKKRGKFVNAWFFVHKAVFFSTNPRLKKHYEINHKDYDTKNNRLSNLEYIHRSLNHELRRTDTAEPAF